MYWPCHSILGVIFFATESLKKLVWDSLNSFLLVVFHPVNHYWRCVVNPLYNTTVFVELLRPVRTLLSFSTWPPLVCIVFHLYAVRCSMVPLQAFKLGVYCILEMTFSVFPSTWNGMYEILFIWANIEALLLLWQKKDTCFDETSWHFHTVHKCIRIKSNYSLVNCSIMEECLSWKAEIFFFLLLASGAQTNWFGHTSCRMLWHYYGLLMKAFGLG